jgi:signal transduction histidine kinase
MKFKALKYRTLFIIPSLVLLWCTGYAVPDSSNSTINLEGHWQYRWGMPPQASSGKHTWLAANARDTSWKFIERPELIDDHPNETDLWTQTVLPEGYGHNPAIYIFYVKEYLEVFFDDSLIYRFGDFSFQNKTPFRAWVWHLIDLPEHCAGHTLTLHIRSNVHTVVIEGQVMFGSSKTLLDEMLRNDAVSFFLGVGYICIGLLFFAISFIVHEVKKYRGIIAAPIGLGMFQLFPLAIMQWIYFAPQLYYFLEHVGLYLCCVGFLMLMESLLAVPFKKIFTRLWKFMLLYGSAMMILEITVHPTNLTHTVPLYCMITLCLVFFFWYSMKSFRLIAFDMRVPLIALNTYAVFVLIEIGVYYYGIVMRFEASDNRFLNIGSISLFLILGWMIFSHYDKMNKRIIISQQEALKNQQLAHEAIERQQRERAEHEQNLILSRERERLRIAQDLHDEIGSRLTEIRIVSEMAKEHAQPNSIIKNKLKELSAATEDVVSTFSEIVWSLNPKNDSLEDLAAYIGQRAIDFLAAAGVSCQLDLPLEFPAIVIESQVRHHLVMAMKETLNNIAKHADASVVTLGMSMNDGLLTLVIQDDGHGFDEAAVRKDGNGLTNIRKRIERLGGKALIESVSGRGTKVTLQIDTKNIYVA